MDDHFDLELLLAEYRAEARQQIDRLERALVTLEETGDLDAAEHTELLRVLHTLKGNSAMLGYRPIAERVHSLESLLRDHSSLPVDLDRLFELSATLRSAIERVGGPEEADALQRLEAIDLRPGAGSIPSGAPRETARHGEAMPRAATADAGPAPAEERERDAGASAASEAAASEITATGPAATRSGAGERAVRVDPGQEEIVRVPFGKLDALLDRVGEVVSLHARIDATIARHRAALEAVGLHRELDERAEDLGALSESLRDATMDLRLVPLGNLFGRFPAVVRELARDQGKRARLVTSGEEIQLDKTAIDALGDPLMHLVRNAVDHGIEPPDQRERLGKDPTGTIHMRAERRGDHIVLEIGDDGGGLDRAEILRRARESGLVDPGTEPSFEELTNLIFSAGFSTRREATMVSGRGVGLDIVRQNLLRLRGSLEVREEVAGGTTFSLRLPLTLAIVSAVLFEIGDEILSVATTDVRETLHRVRFEPLGAATVVRLEDEVIPVAPLDTLFGWNGTGGGARAQAARYAIVVQRGMRTAAIPADRLVDQRGLVVKALPRHLGTVPGVSGATVAPDGRVILLLDADALLDLNRTAQRRVSGAR